MARAAQVEKKPAVPRGGRVDGGSRAMEAPTVLRDIPVDLTPLLAPYKKHGRLTLRIERMPAKSRFSRGSRNNDGASWSLAGDELEDLTFQLPEGYDGEPTLSVRVIGLTAGNTLAVLDFVVAPGAADAGLAAETCAIGGADVAPRGDAELQHLREELTKAHDALVAREAELSEVRQRADAGADEKTVEAALSSARAAWNAELKARLTTAAAQAQAQIAEARALWQRETHDALLKAESAWKGAEAARLAEVQTHWRDESAKALAAACAKASAESGQNHAAELEALRGTLNTLQTRLAERETALTLAGKAAEQARESSQREAHEVLRKAETAWKSAEDERLAAAEALSQERSAKALAAAQAHAHALAREDRSSEVELQALREKAAALQESLAQRDAALTHAAMIAEQARLTWQREMQDTLLRAERDWKAQEPVRESAGALAEAMARCEAAEAALAQARLKPKDDSRLQSELAAVRATLAKREAELAQSRSAIGQSSERREPETVAQPFRVRDLVKPPEKDRKPGNGRLIRDVSIAACFGVVGVVFYPEISALIFGDAPVSAPAKPVIAAAVPVPPVVEPRMAAVRVAKLRAGPATTSDVVSMLQRGADVAVIEVRGKWTLVRVDGERGKSAPLQGWVSSALLKDAEPIDKKPPAAKGK